MVSRMVWIGRNVKDNVVLTPCRGKGCHPLEQLTQTSIQPTLENFQEWGIVCGGNVL